MTYTQSRNLDSEKTCSIVKVRRKRKKENHWAGSRPFVRTEGGVGQRKGVADRSALFSPPVFNPRKASWWRVLGGQNMRGIRFLQQQTPWTEPRSTQTITRSTQAPEASLTPTTCVWVTARPEGWMPNVEFPAFSSWCRDPRSIPVWLPSWLRSKHLVQLFAQQLFCWDGVKANKFRHGAHTDTGEKGGVRNTIKIQVNNHSEKKIFPFSLSQGYGAIFVRNVLCYPVRNWVCWGFFFFF